MPNLRNGSKGGFEPGLTFFASPAFYHRATALHSSDNKHGGSGQSSNFEIEN